MHGAVLYKLLLTDGSEITKDIQQNIMMAKGIEAMSNSEKSVVKLRLSEDMSQSVSQ